MLLSAVLFAQNHADSLYLTAKNSAYAGNYSIAIQQLEQLLVLRPGDYDGQVLLARTYYWQGELNKSLLLLTPAVRRAPNDVETQLLYLDVLLANKQSEDVLSHLLTRTAAEQEKAGFKFRYIKALYQLKRYEEALDAVNIYLVATPDNLSARELQQQLIRLVANQALLLEMEMSSFDVPLSNWYSLALGYENRLKSGPLQFRLHAVNRFDQSAAQLEVDFYPRINEKTTGYFGIGLSNNTLFPGFRWGAEIYRSLPQAWEISAGIRQLYFKNNPLTTYTVAATKYIGSYYISLRPFIIPYQGSIYLTSSLAARRYFKDARHYIGLSTAVGNSPDMDFRLNDPNSEGLNPNLYLLDALSLRFDYQRPLGNRQIIKPHLEYRREEFRPSNYRSRISLGLSLTRSF